MKTFVIIFCGILALIAAIVILKLSQKKKPPVKPGKKPAKIKTAKRPVLKKPKPHARQAEIDAIAKDHPDVVGLIIKQWLNEGSKKKD